jgi:hypothetical protein
MKTLMKSLVTVCLLFSGVAKSDDLISFESMKQLVGEWSGTLNRSTGEKAALSLSYSLRSNGSALLEESNEDGVEMLTIFNVEQTSMKATHYCGLMNKPVAQLTKASDGVIEMKVDPSLSGVKSGTDQFVTGWKLDLMPEDPDKFLYSYTVENPDGSVDESIAIVSRVN